MSRRTTGWVYKIPLILVGGWGWGQGRGWRCVIYVDFVVTMDFHLNFVLMALQSAIFILNLQSGCRVERFLFLLRSWYSFSWSSLERSGVENDPFLSSHLLNAARKSIFMVSVRNWMLVGLGLVIVLSAPMGLRPSRDIFSTESLWKPNWSRISNTVLWVFRLSEIKWTIAERFLSCFSLSSTSFYFVVRV